MLKPYQIFIGCPFAKEVRSSYDRLKGEIEADSPLSIVLADTAGISSSNYLLLKHHDPYSGVSVVHLRRNWRQCKRVFGCRHRSHGASRFCAHDPHEKAFGEDAGPRGWHAGTREVRSIINDLQGKNRIERKEYGSLRKQLDQRYFAHMPYMKRWLAFAKQNKGMVPYALLLFEDLRSSARSQTSRLAAHVEGMGFSASQVLAALKTHKLVVVKAGRTGGIFYPPK